MNVGSKEVFKAGSALAAGVAKRGETCGALTGAIMAIGTLVGREKLKTKSNSKRLWRWLIRYMSGSERRSVTRFVRRFIKSAMGGRIGSLSQRRAGLFTMTEAISEKDAQRFVALQLESPQELFSS